MPACVQLMALKARSTRPPVTTGDVPCNGWDQWYLEENGEMIQLDVLRQRYRLATTKDFDR
jgi:hypothetical protein